MTGAAGFPMEVPARTDHGTQSVPQRLLWHAYAAVYDGLLGLVEYRRLIERVTDAAEVEPGASVVEVGCGTGNVLASLARRGPVDVLGIDSSPAMLARARGKLRSPQVRLVQGDLVAELSKLPSHSVHRLVAVNVLYALPDRSAFWRQAARVVTPGGAVIATQCDRPGFLPLLREQLAAYGWRGLLRPKLVAVAAFDCVIDAFARNRRFSFCGYDAIAQEARDGGLAAEYLGRCYGGPEDGVNILVRLRHREGVPR